MTKKSDTPHTDPSLPDVKAGEVEAAKKEGMMEAVKEGAKAQFLQTDGTPFAGEKGAPKVVPTYDVFHLQELLELTPDALKDALEGKDKPEGTIGISNGQAAGLLEVERSGKNRTDIVKVLMDHLGLKSPYEVTDAGPNFTNDVSRVTLSRD